VVYVGSQMHKRHLGDFELAPPAQPRLNKSLCDGVRIDREQAQPLLKRGVRFGLVSLQQRGRFPQNVWAVAPDGVALEAQLDNVDRGTYHGYPMIDGDPLAAQVIQRWQERLPHE